MKPLRSAPLEIRDHNSEFEINLTINTCQTHNNSYTTDFVGHLTRGTSQFESFWRNLKAFIKTIIITR